MVTSHSAFRLCHKKAELKNNVAHEVHPRRRVDLLTVTLFRVEDCIVCSLVLPVGTSLVATSFCWLASFFLFASHLSLSPRKAFPRFDFQNRA